MSWTPEKAARAREVVIDNVSRELGPLLRDALAEIDRLNSVILAMLRAAPNWDEVRDILQRETGDGGP